MMPPPTPVPSVTHTTFLPSRAAMAAEPRDRVEQPERDEEVSPEREREVGELRCIAAGVVDAVYQRPLERKPPSFGLQVLPACLHEQRKGVAAVERDDLVPQLVAGGVEGHRKIDR